MLSNNSLIILGLLTVLIVVFYTANTSVEIEKKSDLIEAEPDPERNYYGNRNSFRNHYRVPYFQGERVDWKPSQPYYHLTPDFGLYSAQQQAEECLLEEEESDWLFA